MHKRVEIFIDGSCLKNPGPGGYGVILQFHNHKKLLSAGYCFTTNNRMELMAAIVALETLTKSCKVIINTDSQYVYQGITHWIKNWKKYNWQTNSKKLVKNIDLWRRLDLALNMHEVNWQWIKAHNGHLENEYCDELARCAATHPHLHDIGYRGEV